MDSYCNFWFMIRNIDRGSLCIAIFSLKDQSCIYRETIGLPAHKGCQNIDSCTACT